MRQIVPSTPDHLELLCQNVAYVPTPHLRGITLLVDGEPRLIVGYDCWTEGAVSMHQWCAEPRFYGRDIMREAFKYAFVTCERTVVVGTVRSDNPRALMVDLKMGFEPVGFIKDAYGPGVGMHILQLRRENCRWI